MDRSAILLQRFVMGAAGDEEGVEHGGAHAFQVMGWLHTRAAGRLVFALAVDGGSSDTDDEGECVGGFE